MKKTQITNFYPAGFPGQITNRNLAHQMQSAISDEVHYISELVWYDYTPQTNASIYDDKSSIKVTGRFKSGVDYNIQTVAGIVINSGSFTQGVQYAFTTPDNEVLEYQPNKQFSIQPLNQLISNLLCVKEGDTGGLARGSVLAKKLPTASDTALDAITYYAFAGNVPAGYIELPYRVVASNLQTNDTFIYVGTGIQLCRVSYSGGK